MEKIDLFLSVNYGDGSGNGSCYCDEDGYVLNGKNEFGRGSGLGAGDGNGSGSGSGLLSGSGSGYGDGIGDGIGDGSGYLSINGNKVYMIDDLPTIIYSVIGNYAKGAILRNDLTLEPCFIAKVGNCFAHGETLKQAFDDATDKYNETLSEEERIDMFLAHFKEDKTYLASEFFRWHNTLTGSCEFGRRNFCQEKGIDIDKDYLTIDEFIRLTENSYGSEIIKQLKSVHKSR